LPTGQIKFPATQNASSNANTLDDYEEGTWTPAIGGTATYSDQTGTYTKIGRLVHCSWTLGITLIGTGSATTISGLPFTNAGSAKSAALSYWDNLALTATWLGAYVTAGAAVINFVKTAAAVNAVTDTTAVIGNATTIYGSITLEV
jgi:hypothetical protein